MFELLEHPADIGFRTCGATRSAELFENAALALVSIALDPDHARAARVPALEAEGSDYESLLVNWLNEVLWWLDGKRIAFHRFQVTPHRTGQPARHRPRRAARSPDATRPA